MPPISRMRSCALGLVHRPPHLPGIDGEALFAAYDRLAPGTLAEELSAESLGPWDDTSFHLRGDLDGAGGEAAFGVAFRNGLARPWAVGTAPLAELADNSALFGTARWSGALLGVTSKEVEGPASNPDIIEMADTGSTSPTTTTTSPGAGCSRGIAWARRCLTRACRRWCCARVPGRRSGWRRPRSSAP